MGLTVPERAPEPAEYLFMVLPGVWAHVANEMNDVRWIIEAHTRSVEKVLEARGPRTTADI